MSYVKKIPWRKRQDNYSGKQHRLRSLLASLGFVLISPLANAQLECTFDSDCTDERVCAFTSLEQSSCVIPAISDASRQRYELVNEFIDEFPLHSEYMHQSLVSLGVPSIDHIEFIENSNGTTAIIPWVRNDEELSHVWVAAKDREDDWKYTFLSREFDLPQEIFNHAEERVFGRESGRSTSNTISGIEFLGEDSTPVEDEVLHGLECWREHILITVTIQDIYVINGPGCPTAHLCEERIYINTTALICDGPGGGSGGSGSGGGGGGGGGTVITGGGNTTTTNNDIDEYHKQTVDFLKTRLDLTDLQYSYLLLSPKHLPPIISRYLHNNSSDPDAADHAKMLIDFLLSLVYTTWDPPTFAPVPGFDEAYMLEIIQQTAGFVPNCAEAGDYIEVGFCVWSKLNQYLGAALNLTPDQQAYLDRNREIEAAIQGYLGAHSVNGVPEPDAVNIASAMVQVLTGPGLDGPFDGSTEVIFNATNPITVLIPGFEWQDMILKSYDPAATEPDRVSYLLNRQHQLHTKFQQIQDEMPDCYDVATGDASQCSQEIIPVVVGYLVRLLIEKALEGAVAGVIDATLQASLHHWIGGLSWSEALDEVDLWQVMGATFEGMIQSRKYGALISAFTDLAIYLRDNFDPEDPNWGLTFGGAFETFVVSLVIDYIGNFSGSHIPDLFTATYKRYGVDATIRKFDELGIVESLFSNSRFRKYFINYLFDNLPDVHRGKFMEWVLSYTRYADDATVWLNKNGDALGPLDYIHRNLLLGDIGIQLKTIKNADPNTNWSAIKASVKKGFLQLENALNGGSTGFDLTAVKLDFMIPEKHAEHIPVLTQRIKDDIIDLNPEWADFHFEVGLFND